MTKIPVAIRDVEGRPRRSRWSPLPLPNAEKVICDLNMRLWTRLAPSWTIVLVAKDFNRWVV
jgi:hypothetical protein